MIPSEPLTCIDMGTTNCRVFLTEGSRVWARCRGAVWGSRRRSRKISGPSARRPGGARSVEASRTGQWLPALSNMPKLCRGRRYAYFAGRA